MKEENRHSGTGTGGGELGVSSKVYPDAQSGVFALGVKIKEQLPTFLSSQSGGGGGGFNGGDDGQRPTVKAMGNPCFSSACHFAAGSSGDSITVTVGDNGITSTAAVRSSLQPFDFSHLPKPFFKSPVSGMATASGSFPFTAEQWKELQRQAMIYKYMVACVPVPRNLLIPMDPSGSAFLPWGKMDMLNSRWGGSGKDAEPGRCKRTDGKKWRCSKDVAPNQKYCERHLNRGRPRSRKPVEIHTDFPINSTKTWSKKTSLGDVDKTRNLSNSKARASGSSSASQSVGIACPVPGFDGNQGRSGSHFSASMVSLPSLNKEPRSFNRLARDEGAEGQLQQLKKAGLLVDDFIINSFVFQHHFVNEPYGFSPNKAKLDGLGYINAWTNGVPWNGSETGSGGTCSVASNGNDSPSSLAMSMWGRNLIDDELCRIHMGLGVDSSCNSPVVLKDQVSCWASSSSWVSSNTHPGGPLAEVLRPRPLPAEPTCSNSRNVDFITPPSTAVSSPSGVLQKNLASFSDSSGSNSPICEESKATYQIPFQWLS